MKPRLLGLFKLCNATERIMWQGWILKPRLLDLFKLCNATARNICQEWILKPELLASIQLCNFTAIPPQKNDFIFKDSLKI